MRGRRGSIALLDLMSGLPGADDSESPGKLDRSRPGAGVYSVLKCYQLTLLE